jgi:hypothetical protein
MLEVAVMSAVLHADEEEQATPLTRRRWATVVAVAILDITGVLVTVAAAAILMLNDGTDRRWWWAVGLASILAVFTTAVLTHLAYQHRAFIRASTRLAEHLEGLAQRGEKLPPQVLRLANRRLEAADVSGHHAIADRLTIALARLA